MIETITAESTAAKPRLPAVLITLFDLKRRSCRWPVGRPRDADFGFCGAETAEGEV